MVAKGKESSASFATLELKTLHGFSLDTNELNGVVFYKMNLRYKKQEISRIRSRVDINNLNLTKQIIKEQIHPQQMNTYRSIFSYSPVEFRLHLSEYHTDFILELK